VAELALVCGAGGALGAALLDTLLGRGDRVVGIDHHPDDSPTRPGLRRESLDLTEPDEVERLWERLAAAGETPRWVVNAAGGFRGGSVADSEPAGVRILEQLNLGTAWWSCREAARHLPEGGAIVNVAARAARSGGAGSAAYAVAKAGVVRLTEVLAAELAPRGVRVNAILPSLIDTQANREAMTPEALRHAVPPHELASVVGFLLSEAAAAVTGAIIPVYGLA
jgi:NAD(P)-dependent dehydrogenase (short-subunit alcohol dehydrogenase family)